MARKPLFIDTADGRLKADDGQKFDIGDTQDFLELSEQLEALESRAAAWEALADEIMAGHVHGHVYGPDLYSVKGNCVPCSIKARYVALKAEGESVSEPEKCGAIDRDSSPCFLPKGHDGSHLVAFDAGYFKAEGESR